MDIVYWKFCENRVMNLQEEIKLRVDKFEVFSIVTARVMLAANS